MSYAMDGKIIFESKVVSILTVIAVAALSLAMQLANGCVKLYDFWNSVRDAPKEVAVITDDLMLLSRVLRDISHSKRPAPAVTLGLECCKAKILVSPSTCAWLGELADVVSRSSIAS